MSNSEPPNTETTKTIVVFLNNQPSPEAAVLFSDATISRVRLEKALGRRVKEITPKGRIRFQNRTVQWATKDVTRRATETTVKSWLRAVMALRPKLHRVGVICHRPHVSYVESIGEPFQGRLVKVSYFGGGEDRASNAWPRQCDLLIVLGTPRVSPRAVQRYFFQLGNVKAACQIAEWGTLRWRGQTESGQELVIPCRGYLHNLEWRAAHRDLVRSALVQAVGRGRGILPGGCEVVVLSNEECGLPLADDQNLDPLGEAECQAFIKLAELTHLLPIDILLGERCVNGQSANPVKPPGIASALGISAKHAREMLTRLERRGLVCRVGQRSGWKLTEAGDFLARGSGADG